MINKFQPSISIIRVLAMISIIFGHWLTMKGINHFQFGAIGVQIFLFISGWLQSNKQIDDYPKWFFSKLKRIMLPYYLGLILLILLRLCFHLNTPIEAITVHMINMQGLNKLFGFVDVTVITGYGHTWFLTVLTICYILTALLKINPNLDVRIYKNKKIWIMILIIVHITLMFFRIQIGGLICYFFGYYMAREEKPCKKKLLRLTWLVLLSTILRFIVYLYLHESIVYKIIFTWSFVFLGIWITILGMYICEKRKEGSYRLSALTLWRLLDLGSYPLFLVHYIFLKGDFSVENWIRSNAVIQGLIFVFLSLFLSTIMLLLTDRSKLMSIIKNARTLEDKK